MMNILDELSYAENMLLHGFSKYISGRELRILTRYYRYIGIEEFNLWNKIVEFCNFHISGFNENIFADLIERVIRQSKKEKLRIPVNVPITLKEVLAIRNINNYRLEKISFTMLFLGKYFYLTNNRKDSSLDSNYYVNFEPSAILHLSHTSSKKGEYLFDDLRILGMIDRTDNYNGYIIKFTSAKDNDIPEILIDKTIDILDFYPPYCKICRKGIEKKSNRQYMCEECWKEKNRNYQKILIKSKRMKNVAS